MIQKYFYTIDIDSAFAIGEESDTLSLKNRAINNLITELAEKKDADFLLLANTFDDKRGFDKIKKYAFKIYDFLTNQPSIDDFKNRVNNAYLGTLTAGDTPNKSVTLTNNSLSNYTLLVKRTDNTKITNSVTLKNIDSRKATLNLTLNVEGMNVNYNCKANMLCKSWQFIVYEQKNSTIIRTGTINSGSTTSVSSVISDLQVNTPYYLQVTAITNSSNLLTESNLVPFELKGVGRIWDGNNWHNGVVYVYDGNKWQQVIPYIYDGNEWVICV